MYGMAYQIPVPTVITPPDIEPVTLAELKRHLRIEDHDDAGEDDDLANSLIPTARRYIENRCKISMIDQTLETSFDCYPPFIGLRGPVIEVLSFTYRDGAGDE